jgi:hypothetical protein
MHVLYMRIYMKYISTYTIKIQIRNTSFDLNLGRRKETDLSGSRSHTVMEKVDLKVE